MGNTLSTTLAFRNTIISALTFLLISCSQPTATTEAISEPVVDTAPREAEVTVDDYFENIYRQEKLIIAEDIIMLSVVDSLSSNDPDKNLFYFIVFTKSMNGSDGFYSEAVALAAFEYITTQTERFAVYFNTSPKLTDMDMDNWASYIFGEIEISRENHELKAVDELEIQLLDNIKGAENEYKVIIERLLEKIKSTAHNNS